MLAVTAGSLGEPGVTGRDGGPGSPGAAGKNGFPGSPGARGVQVSPPQS